MTGTKRRRPIVVSLHDIIAHMDLPNDAWTAYLNRRTGELVSVTDGTPDDAHQWLVEITLIEE